MTQVSTICDKVLANSKQLGCFALLNRTIYIVVDPTSVDVDLSHPRVHNVTTAQSFSLTMVYYIGLNLWKTNSKFFIIPIYPAGTRDVDTPSTYDLYFSII